MYPLAVLARGFVICFGGEGSGSRLVAVEVCQFIKAGRRSGCETVSVCVAGGHDCGCRLRR